MPDLERSAEIAGNLAEFRERVERACQRHGRSPADVTLVAVTKTFPASDVRLLAQLGITDVGENRDQEAAPKHAETVDLPLRWHFVGQLQRNKSASVARYADVVHSVDRAPLVASLDAAAQAAERVVTALIQVSVDPAGPADGRSGAPADHVRALAEAIAAAAGLRLGGVMAVARLAEVAAALRADHPEASTISAGMSGDFESALAHGATHLRVGTALLGRRSVGVR